MTWEEEKSIYIRGEIHLLWSKSMQHVITTEQLTWGKVPMSFFTSGNYFAFHVLNSKWTFTVGMWYSIKAKYLFICTEQVWVSFWDEHPICGRLYANTEQKDSPRPKKRLQHQVSRSFWDSNSDKTCTGQTKAVWDLEEKGCRRAGA